MAGIHPDVRFREGAATAGDAVTEAAMWAVALDGIRSGRSMRVIAIALYGADRAAACWHSDSRMRAKVRRLVNCSRAEACAGQGTP